eukprot:8123343-Lingulodinium_polyedra.AAC.1
MPLAEARLGKGHGVRGVRDVRREVLEVAQLEHRCPEKALRERARARARESRRGVDQTRPNGGPPLD